MVEVVMYEEIGFNMKMILLFIRSVYPYSHQQATNIWSTSDPRERSEVQVLSVFVEHFTGGIKDRYEFFVAPFEGEWY